MKAVAVLLAFLAGLLVYANTLQHGFVWDDHIVIVDNPLLSDPASTALKLLSPAYWREVSPVLASARPLFLASLLLDRAWWGSQPWGYHLTNVLLHGLNSALVCLLGTALLGTSGAGLLAGLVFAAHPIHAEAVNLPSFRPDLLATLFVLLALACHLRLRAAARTSAKLAWLAGSIAVYGLGLLSKEMAATWPALALLYEAFAPRSQAREGGKRRAAARWAWPLAVAALCGLTLACYLEFRKPRSGYHAISAGPAPGSFAPEAQGEPSSDMKEPAPRRAAETPAPHDEVRAPPPVQQVFNPSGPQWQVLYEKPWVNFLSMSVVLADYFRLMAAPHPLSAERAPRITDSAAEPRLWLSWLLLAALLAAAALARGTRHWPAGWALTWCFASFAPVSNAIPIFNPVAERYLYLVSVGAAWAMAHILAESAASLGRRRLPAAACWALPGLLVAAYAGLTWQRNKDWKDDATLLAAEERHGSSSARVYYNLGVQRQGNGQLGEAERYYEQALVLHPNYVEALIKLGQVYESTHRNHDALKVYRRAVALRPKVPIPYLALGKLLENTGSRREAIAVYEQAWKTKLDYAPARLQLGEALVRAGKTAEALNVFRQALEVDSSAAHQAQLDMGMVHADVRKDYKSALPHLLEAAKSDPNDHDALVNLGVTYHRDGDFPNAARWLEKAVKRFPFSADALVNLGVVYRDMGRLEEARKTLERALATAPDHLPAHLTLADVCERLDLVDEAIRHYEQTLRLDPGRVDVLVQLADLHAARKDCPQAESYYLQVLEQSPDSLPLSLKLGNLYFDCRDYGRAQAVYEGMRDKFKPPEGKDSVPSPAWLESLVKLGHIHFSRGDFEAAYESYRVAAETFWDGRAFPVPVAVVPLLSRLGLCHFKLGRWERAAANWEVVVRERPDYAEIYKPLAESYRRMKEDVKARGLLERWNGLDAKTVAARPDIEAPFLVAFPSQALDMTPQTLRDSALVQAVLDYNADDVNAVRHRYQHEAGQLWAKNPRKWDLRPENLQLFTRYAHIDFLEGRYDRARHLYRAIGKKLWPNVEGPAPSAAVPYMIRIGLCHYKQANWLAAASNWETALERSPKRVELHILLAQTYAEMKRPDLASAAWQRFLKLDAQLGMDRDTAYRAYTRAFELWPGRHPGRAPPPEIYGLLDKISQIEFDRGDFDNAALTLRFVAQAMWPRPDRVPPPSQVIPYLIRIGQCHSKMGRWTAAAAYWEKALEAEDRVDVRALLRQAREALAGQRPPLSGALVAASDESQRRRRNALTRFLLWELSVYRLSPEGTPYYADVAANESTQPPPEEYDLVIQRGDIEFHQGEYPKALALYRAVSSQLWPGTGPYAPDVVPIALRIAHCRFKMGQWENAAANWEEALRTDPAHPEAYPLLAEAYRKLEKPDKERGAWTRLLKLDAENAEARRALGQD